MTTLFSPAGDVVTGFVEPKMAIVGIPSAPATCIRPESFERKRAQRAISGDRLLQVRLSGDVDQGVAGALLHRGGALPVAGAAEENRLCPGVVDQAVGDGGEPFRKPFLCRPVGGTGRDADQGAVSVPGRYSAKSRSAVAA